MNIRIIRTRRLVKMNNFKEGDIVWYETGYHSACKVKIVGVEGNGATKTYIVHFIDHSPDQTDGSELNRNHYPNGGIPVSYRKCKSLT